MEYCFKNSCFIFEKCSIYVSEAIKDRLNLKGTNCTQVKSFIIVIETYNDNTKICELIIKPTSTASSRVGFPWPPAYRLLPEPLFSTQLRRCPAAIRMVVVFRSNNRNIWKCRIYASKSLLMKILGWSELYCNYVLLITNVFDIKRMYFSDVLGLQKVCL